MLLCSTIQRFEVLLNFQLFILHRDIKLKVLFKYWSGATFRNEIIKNFTSFSLIKLEFSSPRGMEDKLQEIKAREYGTKALAQARISNAINELVNLSKHNNIFAFFSHNHRLEMKEDGSKLDLTPYSNSFLLCQHLILLKSFLVADKSSRKSFPLQVTNYYSKTTLVKTRDFNL